MGIPLQKCTQAVERLVALGMGSLQEWKEVEQKALEELEAGSSREP